MRALNARPRRHPRRAAMASTTTATDRRMKDATATSSVRVLPWVRAFASRRPTSLVTRGRLEPVARASALEVDATVETISGPRPRFGANALVRWCLRKSARTERATDWTTTATVWSTTDVWMATTTEVLGPLTVMTLTTVCTQGQRRRATTATTTAMVWPTRA